MRRESSDERQTVSRPHHLTMENRQHALITGVEDVDSFNEEMIVLLTSAGAMTLVGTGLHISQLNLEEGQLVIDGQIAAMEYDERSRGSRGSMISRLFK
ncbi:sporulation protein YabP [Eubacteriales bacterium OttesenSCG-928-N13]|nr:sporulation protein YabP [Eubacteriales bacterium OttesenSCG-928-N13]